MSRTAWVSALGWLAACSSGAARPPSRDAGPADDAGTDAGAVELAARLELPEYAEVGQPVTLDASGSTGATGYGWTFGDGRQAGPSAEPVAEIVYERPGRYLVVLTVSGEDGGTAFTAEPISVTERVTFSPATSGTLAELPGGGVAVVSVDSNELVLLTPDFVLDRRIATGRSPRTVTVWGDWLAVACQDDGVVELHSRQDSGRQSVALGPASGPYGVLELDGSLFVTLQATGELVEIVMGEDARVLRRFAVSAEARGLAALPDGRLAVTSWRSGQTGGSIAVVRLDTEQIETWALPVDPSPPLDITNYGVNNPIPEVLIGGVPTFLNQVIVSPTGLEAAVPGLQANVGYGEFRAGEPLTPETLVRSVVAMIDPVSGLEAPFPRRQLNDRGYASAAVYSPRGDYLYVAMRDNGVVTRLDRIGSPSAGGDYSAGPEELGLRNVGRGLDGVALVQQGRYLVVDAELSREVVVYDTAALGGRAEPIARVGKVEREPLDETILLGKRLFNDASDPRLSSFGYVACAHCHMEGLADRFVWDFSDQGEGLRSTIVLQGRGGGDGPLHWSGNFDEVQDFEHALRDQFGGQGLLADEALAEGTRGSPLGDAKAGLSEELDALAAYVQSLRDERPSPLRNPDGSLTDAAERGRVLFGSERTGCTGCHTGDRLTDSRFASPAVPLLHDVGTMGPGSGRRLGAELTGIDTPTLHGLWASAPYLHDGSAASLRDVLTTRNPEDRHGTTSGLSSEELDDLVAYLTSLDGRTD